MRSGRQGALGSQAKNLMYVSLAAYICLTDKNKNTVQKQKQKRNKEKSSLEVVKKFETI